jgi:hypothetical protein
LDDFELEPLSLVDLLDEDDEEDEPAPVALPEWWSRPGPRR